MRVSKTGLSRALTKEEAAARLAANPWWVVILFLLASVGFAAYLAAYAQPNWREPAERELKKVGGKFQDPTYTGIGFRPYLFVDDDGIKHTLDAFLKYGSFIVSRKRKHRRMRLPTNMW